VTAARRALPRRLFRHWKQSPTERERRADPRSKLATRRAAKRKDVGELIKTKVLRIARARWIGSATKAMAASTIVAIVPNTGIFVSRRCCPGPRLRTRTPRSASWIASQPLVLSRGRPTPPAFDPPCRRGQSRSGEPGQQSGKRDVAIRTASGDAWQSARRVALGRGLAPSEPFSRTLTTTPHSTSR